MSRTFKDAPFWIWQASRLNAPCPDPVGPWRSDRAPAGSPYGPNASAWDAWIDSFPLDPAVRTQKARRKSQRLDRRLQEGRYRTYVRGRIAHGDYDGIEAPEHLPGYLWWW